MLDCQWKYPIAKLTLSLPEKSKTTLLLSRHRSNTVFVLYSLQVLLLNLNHIRNSYKSRASFKRIVKWCDILSFDLFLQFSNITYVIFLSAFCTRSLKFYKICCYSQKNFNCFDFSILNFYHVMQVVARVMSCSKKFHNCRVKLFLELINIFWWISISFRFLVFKRN